MDVFDQQTMKKNEINANKALCTGSIFTAIVLVVLIILYVTGVFRVSHKTLINIYISFPIFIALLGSTFFFRNGKWVEFGWVKYYLVFQFITIMFVINILLPKHGILGWALAMILVTHYFNPKVTFVASISIAVLMLAAIYTGMLYGEWDANLMGDSGYFDNGLRYVLVDGVPVEVDDITFEQRVEFLKELRAMGDNRYLKAFLYYYLPRLLVLGIISNTCYGLSSRASHLLKEEVEQVKINQKMSGELEMARNIQNSVLPQAFVDNHRENIAAVMDPAKEVGGDFYDYFYIDNNRMAFLIADVSGKGVPGALFMMKTEALIKSLTTTLKDDTALIMARSNIALCQNNDTNMFVTCWLGILNLANGELKYTNAGHTNPLIISGNGVRILEGERGVVLGALEESRYKENTITLNRGDKVILYTDGVTEAHNDKDELFGEKRLIEFTKKNIKNNVRDYIHNLRVEIKDFANGYEQFDDITMLVFEYRKGAMLMESRIFKADVKELDNLFEYSSTLLEVLDFTKRDIIMINTALEEVFVNVAKYAYDAGGEVEVSLSNDKNKVTFVFRDSGKPFNPLTKEDPNINASSEEREVGGLGIYMVKNIMDNTYYEYKDGHNVLTLVKYRNTQKK